MSALSQAAKSLCAKTGIKHQQALDVVAQAMGYRDYNTYLGSHKKALLPHDADFLQSIVGGTPVASMNKIISVLQGSRQVASEQDIIREVWSPSTFRFLYEFFRERKGTWPDFCKYYKPFMPPSPTERTDSFMTIPRGLAKKAGETAPPWSQEIEKMAYDFIADCVKLSRRDNMSCYVPYRTCHINAQRMILPAHGVFPKDVSEFYDRNPSKKRYLTDSRYMKIAPVVDLTIAVMASVTSIGFSVDEPESLFSQAVCRAEVNALQGDRPSIGKIVSFGFNEIGQPIEQSVFSFMLAQQAKFAETVCASMRLFDEGVVLPCVSYEMVRDELLSLYENAENMRFPAFDIAYSGFLSDKLDAVRRVLSKAEDIDLVFFRTDSLFKSSKKSVIDEVVAFIQLIGSHLSEKGRHHSLIVINGASERFIA